MPDLTITAVVGNPRPGSRTLTVAQQMTDALAAALDVTGRAVVSEVVELADYGPRVLDPQDAAVDEAVARTASSSVLLAVSPTYKATYTGLLKSFLDRVPMNGLAGVVGIPVMVGAAPVHSMAVEAHLRPLLVELGASCPAPGLFVMERQLDQLDALVGRWIERAAAQLAAATSVAERVHS